MEKKSKKNSIDPSTLVYGKMPPQAKEFEEAVLGAIMLQRGAYDEASAILKPEMFYVDAHQRIYKAITALANKAQPIDTLTVIEQLRSTEELDIAGGPYGVSKLTDSVVSAFHIQHHSEVIFKKFLKREQIRIAVECLNDGYEDSIDAYDGLDTMQAKINSLSIQNVSVTVPLTTLLIERFKRLEALRHRDDHLTGVPSGFKNIDLLTAGWQDTDLIIIAARPSVGKTAFALNIARNAASHVSKPTPVAFFSLEMSGGQLVDRLMSSESGIGLDLIARAKMDDSLMQRLQQNGLRPLSGYNLFIEDSPSLNIYELNAKCRRLKKDENIGLIIIDYLQLMSGVSDDRIRNREQEISNISRSLKALAKELKVPIIALSQLSREIEKRKGDPQLSDLRDSGAIEQDADIVMFLTRPDYQQTDMTEESTISYGDIHIKKHRNGDLAKIPMRTVLSIQRWMTDEEYNLYQRNLSCLTPVRKLSTMKDTNGDNPF